MCYNYYTKTRYIKNVGNIDKAYESIEFKKYKEDKV